MIFSLLCRYQVEPRHNKVKYHLGSYKHLWEAYFAWDFSLFLILSFQAQSEKDKYHYQWSYSIFKKFECLPDKPALVPIYKQLRSRPICGKGESKDKELTQFCKAARNRIKEMMPDLRDAMVCHAKMVVMGQLAGKDLVLLGEFMKICPEGYFMNIILSRHLTENFYSELDYQGDGHPATSAPQGNISAAKSLVLKQINDDDWVMLEDFVQIVGIGCFMFTLCKILSEVSPFEQDILSDAHHEMPVHLQERNSGYASFDHAQNSATSEALAGPSSHMDDQVLMNQSSANVDSGLKPCKIKPTDYPLISREDDVWMGKDLAVDPLISPEHDVWMGKDLADYLLNSPEDDVWMGKDSE
jgi:hypothetical protein